ncbi:MAG: anti-sigma factor family protein [Planctomycetota bacterium]|jgi:anti-sigma factor RsiW
MNMTQEALEIMIGKYLDGEITPSEQRLLEAELDRDPQSKELLGQLQEMHERCGEVVAAELLGRGESADEIFERAWRRQSGQPLRLMAKMRGHVRFAVGLAAGLVIGLALHFVLPIISEPGQSRATGISRICPCPRRQRNPQR